MKIRKDLILAGKFEDRDVHSVTDLIESLATGRDLAIGTTRNARARAQEHAAEGWAEMVLLYWTTVAARARVLIGELHEAGWDPTYAWDSWNEVEDGEYCIYAVLSQPTLDE